MGWSAKWDPNGSLTQGLKPWFSGCSPQEHVMTFITRVLVDLKALESECQGRLVRTCKCLELSWHYWTTLIFNYRSIGAIFFHVCLVFPVSIMAMPWQGSVTDENELRSFAARSFRDGKPLLTISELRRRPGWRGQAAERASRRWWPWINIINRRIASLKHMANRWW